MFWGLIPTFVEVTEEKLVGGPFCPPSPILNRVKVTYLTPQSPFFFPAVDHGIYKEEGKKTCQRTVSPQNISKYGPEKCLNRTNNIDHF